MADKLQAKINEINKKEIELYYLIHKLKEENEIKKLEGYSDIIFQLTARLQNLQNVSRKLIKEYINIEK
jgi:hypothetical protein